MIVEILEDDKRTGVSKGERYKAIRYWLDPQDKVTLLERVPDGWNPNCNEYRHNVKILEPLHNDLHK